MFAKLLFSLALVSVNARDIWRDRPYPYVLGEQELANVEDSYETYHPGYKQYVLDQDNVQVLDQDTQDVDQDEDYKDYPQTSRQPGLTTRDRNVEDYALFGTNSYSDHHELAPRVRRQAQGSVTLNSDGSTGLGAKIPLVGEKNVLSAIGSADFNNQMKPASTGFGLALDNVNGHGLSVMKDNLPGLGSRLTGAGHLNVFHNNNHDVNAKAFVSRTMPSIPNVPNFNTVGGGVDYMYKNKIGASLGMASTPFLQRTDYSAMGNLNLYRNPTTSVDFSGGFKRFDSPFMNSGWKPNFGLSLTKSFRGF